MAKSVVNLDDWREAVEVFMLHSLFQRYEFELLGLMADWYWTAFAGGVEQKVHLNARRTLVANLR